jgi:phospholipid/cholesterol/gamma-HCH transport system substrate-binding protein
METKARHVTIGVLVLAVIAGAFGFVLWLQNVHGAGERAFYRLAFDGSASGLRDGSDVLFNGIRVGKVSKLSLDPSRPQQVIATISIDKNAPVRADTKVGIDYAGLTGIASIALTGGSLSSPRLAGTKDHPPLLVAASDSTQDITQAARATLRRVNDFIDANEAPFHDTLVNLDRFSGVLARNSERVDKIVAGLQDFVGDTSGVRGAYVAAARSVEQLSEAVKKQSAAIAADLGEFSNSGMRQLRAAGAETRRMFTAGKRVAKDIAHNPSRFIFGGSASADK